MAEELEPGTRNQHRKELEWGLALVVNTRPSASVQGKTIAFDDLTVIAFGQQGSVPNCARHVSPPWFQTRS